MLSDIMKRNRAEQPLVHCITNYVTANDCANLLLACGSSAIMADDPEEVSEVTAICDGLVLNLGTPNPRRQKAMEIAGEAANRLGHPVVLDPVGAGSSQMRRDTLRRLLERIEFSVIRGNVGEIRTLLLGTDARRGVDNDSEMCISTENTVAIARELSYKTGAVVIATGSADIVTDGTDTFRVMNGHAMMRKVTGTGCQLSVLVAAFAASNPDKRLVAALAAVCAMGICGEIAFQRLTERDGNASYRNYMIDAMYRLTPEALMEGAKYEVNP